MSSGTESTASDSIVEIGGLRVAPGDRIGSYVYRRSVGQGGMAHVLLAIDPDGRQVALKVLKSTRVGSGYHRFMREFKALSRLRHPNVIRVDALGSLHGHPFIAMEYVEGHDLHYAIHTFRTLLSEERWRRCEEILVDLCRALAYIHRRGLIHRDLKPSNVLLDHDRQSKLTDFGIVKDLDPDADSANSTTLVGTWAYSSPEQISGHPIDHRSDLYSLGVILFAMLTGRRPFVAKDLAGYLELHRNHAPPSPREVDPAVPAHLDEICRRLLRKHPKDRFRSAQEILYRLEQIDPEAELPDFLPWEPPLVGRSLEEEALRGRVAQLTGRGSAAVWLEGVEGSGKTRLLDVVANQGALMGIGVHRVRAGERDGPFSVLLRLAASFGARLPGAGGDPLRVAAAAYADEEERNSRERLFEALSTALGILLEEAPQVVLCDDLHNAQLPTLDALTWLVRRFVSPDETSRCGLFFVGAWRPDRVGGRLGALRNSGGSTSATALVTLGPLLPTAVDDLVLSLIGPGRVADVLSARLLKESEGNPFFLVSYVRHLMTAGVIVRSTGGWRVTADLEEISSGHIDLPSAVRQVVRGRLDAIDDRVRPLLEALAVSGREIELDVLFDVLDLDEEEGLDHIDSLVAHGVARLRRSGQESLLDFTNARYGDVVYRELDPEPRSELHRRIAAALELRYQHAPAAAEVVGEHYRQAGEGGKAFQYLTAAARRARDKGQYAEAWELIARAHPADDAAHVDLSPRAYAAIKHVFLQVRADVLFLRSHWREAREVLEQALTLTAGPEEAVLLRTHIHHGRVLRVLGELDEAEAEIRGSLERARELHDREAVAEGLLVLAGVAWGRGQLDECEGYAQEGLVLATGPGLVGARAHLLLASTAVQASRGQLASAASGLQEAQQLFEELRMGPARSLALANLAEVVLGQGDLGSAWEYATEALEQAEGAGHRLGEAAARVIRGMAAMRAGAWEESRLEFEAAMACARALGVQSELAIPAMHIARLDLEDGDLDAALNNLDTAAAAARLGDPEHCGPAIEVLRAQVHACTDSAEAAMALLTRVEANLGQLPALRRVQVLIDLAETWRLLEKNDIALSRVRDALQISTTRGFRVSLLDALLLQVRLTPEPIEQARIRSDLRAVARDIAATMTNSWQVCFQRRLGLTLQ